MTLSTSGGANENETVSSCTLSLFAAVSRSIAVVVVVVAETGKTLEKYHKHCSLLRLLKVERGREENDPAIYVCRMKIIRKKKGWRRLAKAGDYCTVVACRACLSAQKAVGR